MASGKAENDPINKTESTDPSGFKRQAKDLFAGSVGGIAQVLVGQPWDIVKVRLQTTSNYSGALDCAKSIYRNEGLAAFYKGTTAPLVGIGACVSIQFAGFLYFKRLFEEKNRGRGLSYSQYYLAGAGAGFLNSFVAGPVEHIRIRLQTSNAYSSPVQAIKSVVQARGLKGIYAGQTATVFRELQAYGSWFLAYEFLLNWEMSRTKTIRKEIPAYKLCGYGALSGIVLWIASYPIDVVKSKMQTDDLVNRRYTSTADCIRKTFASGGVGAFWKGITPTLLRAPWASGATFLAVELTMRAIE